MTLTGGSRNEGNILINRQPLCDGNHNANNALVVCRWGANCCIRGHILPPLNHVMFPLEIEFWKNMAKIKILIQITEVLSIISRMLGYPGGQHTTGSHFGQYSYRSPFPMNNVQCFGNETTILDCPHTTEANCGAMELAGVICDGIFQKPSTFLNDFKN